MANEPSQSDSENQSLRKINAGMSALTADVADGIIVNGLSAIDAKLPALSGGRIPVDISSATLSVTADGVEIKNDAGNPIPISDNGQSLTVDGAVTASQGGTWNITNVSGTVSLPTGAATAANQSTTNTSLSSIDTKVATAANQTTTNTTLSTISGKLPSALESDRLKVDGSGVTQPVSGTFWQATQPVSAASLPLPSGSATEAKQDTIIGHIDGLEGHVDGLEGLLTTIDTDTGSIDTKLPSGLTVTSNRLSVDGSGVTQPVSGTFWQATQPVSGTFWQATQPVSGTVTAVPDKGAVTVTAGSTDATPSTSAQALASNANRKFLFIQNASDTDMYFNFGAVATTAHLLLKTGQHGILFGPTFVPTDEVTVICGSASKAYYILSA